MEIGWKLMQYLYFLMNLLGIASLCFHDERRNIVAYSRQKGQLILSALMQRVWSCLSIEYLLCFKFLGIL